MPAPRPIPCGGLLLLKKGHKVIDLSGDFRYDNTDIYEKWYGISHSAKKKKPRSCLRSPEFFGAEVKKRISLLIRVLYHNEYPCAGAAPQGRTDLRKRDRDRREIRRYGAGRKEKLAFPYCETAGNFKAYSVPLHRHTSEIEEQLSKLSRKDVCLLFTPHLLPVKRGILATVYADLMEGVTPETVTAAYEKYYADAPFTHAAPRQAPRAEICSGFQ